MDSCGDEFVTKKEPLLKRLFRVSQVLRFL